MSNIKRVEIVGLSPFHLYEHEPLQPMLAFLSGPTTGMKLEWICQAGYTPNEHGGVTAMYRFSLTGEEAVGWGWLEKFKEEIEAIGGKIESDRCRDIEGG